MKLDLSKLPVLEGLIGFFMVVLIVTFVGAFAATRSDDEDGGEPTASEPPAGSPAPDGSTLAVSLGDNFFEPGEYVVAAGASVTFDITNDGSAIHNMRIAGADNEYDSDDDAVSDPEIVPGGQDAVVTWQSSDAPGEIDFRCDFHPDQMTGTITVQ
jgi:plastocyanin